MMTFFFFFSILCQLIIATPSAAKISNSDGVNFEQEIWCCPIERAANGSMGNLVTVISRTRVITELLRPPYLRSQVYKRGRPCRSESASHGCKYACKCLAEISTGALLLENQNCQYSSILRTNQIRLSTERSYLM